MDTDYKRLHRGVNYKGFVLDAPLFRKFAIQATNRMHNHQELVFVTRVDWSPRVDWSWSPFFSLFPIVRCGFWRESGRPSALAAPRGATAANPPSHHRRSTSRHHNHTRRGIRVRRREVRHRQLDHACVGVEVDTSHASHSPIGEHPFRQPLRAQSSEATSPHTLDVTRPPCTCDLRVVSCSSRRRRHFTPRTLRVASVCHRPPLDQPPSPPPPPHPSPPHRSDHPQPVSNETCCRRSFRARLPVQAPPAASAAVVAAASAPPSHRPSRRQRDAEPTMQLLPHAHA